MFSLSLICYWKWIGWTDILWQVHHTFDRYLRESSRRTLSFSAMNETLFCIFRFSFLFRKYTSATKMQSVVWELLNLHFSRFSKTFFGESQTFLFVFLLNFNMKRKLFFSAVYFVVSYRKQICAQCSFPIVRALACIFYHNILVLPNWF